MENLAVTSEACSEYKLCVSVGYCESFSTSSQTCRNREGCCVPELTKWSFPRNFIVTFWSVLTLTQESWTKHGEYVGSSTKQTRKGREYFLRYSLHHVFFQRKRDISAWKKKNSFEAETTLLLYAFNPRHKNNYWIFLNPWLRWKVGWQSVVVSLRKLGKCGRKELVDSPDTDEESVQISILPGSQCVFSSPDLLGGRLCFYNYSIICHYMITTNSATHNQKSRIFLGLIANAVSFSDHSISR